MTQQNLFPQQTRNGKPSQRAAGKPQAAQLAVVPNRQATTHPKPSAPLPQAAQHSPQKSYRNTGVSPASYSEAQRNDSVRLFGWVGRYFDFKQTQSGKSLATFSLATQRPYRSTSGSWLKKTVWQRVVAWGETAESISALLQKGARVSVEGKFKTREWTDKENNLRTTTELVARHVHFLDMAEA